MSNDASIESTATERLTAPGVVDRGPVLRRYDRLQQPLPNSALTDRLHQRAAYATQADGSALVWQRTSIGTIASGALVPEQPPPTADVGHATTPSMQEPPPPSTDVGHATTPSVQQPPPVQRSVSAAPTGTTARPTVVQRLIQSQPSLGALAAASPAFASHALTQQVHAHNSMEKAAPVAVRRAAVSAPVVVTRKADLTISRRAQPTPLAAIVNRSANPAHADVAALPIRIARKEEAAATRGSGISIPGAPDGIVAITHAAPTIALGPTSPSAITPLVLRRVAAPAPMSPSTPPVPYSMPSTSAVAEELTRAAQAEAAAARPHVGASAAAHAGNPDVERLTAEVERRLRLRLEIERERRGIRSWR